MSGELNAPMLSLGSTNEAADVEPMTIECAATRRLAASGPRRVQLIAERLEQTRCAMTNNVAKRADETAEIDKFEKGIGR